MTSEQERKHIESTLSTKSVCINEGTFMLRVSKNNIQYNDFQKQCLFGDSFNSVYSRNISLIPSGIFLPQMFVGNNVLIEQKISAAKVPFLDSFLPFAFLVHEKDNKPTHDMYDRIFPGYTERYGEMQTSVKHHIEKCCQKISFDENEFGTEDPDTELFCQENEETYNIIFFTQASSVKFQNSSEKQLRFGDKGLRQVVNVQNNIPALFDGYTNSATSNVNISETATKAIRRELLTLTQFYVGFEKSHEGDISQYIENIFNLMRDQHKHVVCKNDNNIESYIVSALMLYLSRSLETEDFNCSSSILSDHDCDESIRKKILFQNLMLLEPGSCFNSRNLSKREMDRGKAAVVTCEHYTSPFDQLFNAVYENISLLTHILTTVTYFSKVKSRHACQSCEQKTCAVNAPALFVHISAGGRDMKKERSEAVTCFFTANNFNKTGPVGNLASKESSDSTTVYWEKHQRDLLKNLLENYQLDLSLYADEGKTSEKNIDERAEKIMEVICTHIDNALSACEQYFRELDEDADNLTKSNVEAEIRNVFRMASMYDKGFTNMLLSESLMYILRSMLLYEHSNLKDTTVNDVFLSMKPLFIDNKSGIAVSQHKNLKNITIKKIAVKSYTSDDMIVNAQSNIVENYNLDEILSQASYKTKINLFGKYEELKNNGGRKKQNAFQNFSNKKLSAASTSTNNSFNLFKSFCSRQASSVLGIETDDFCRFVLNEVRDKCLDTRHYELFTYVNQFKVDTWQDILLLISIMKLLEHLNWVPAYDRVNFLAFNALEKNPTNNKYEFKQNFLCEDFNQAETLYAINTSIQEFTADIQGKSLKFKKCAGKFMDRQNKLIQTFTNGLMTPGPPIFYVPFGLKSSKIKDSTSSSILTKFINEEQFKLEDDAAYTNFIKKHKKQIYDDIFESTFSSDGQYMENRYTPEVLEEMLSEFDERFPSSLFASESIYEFLKLVLLEYFNTDQSRVNIMAKRLKEMYTKVKCRKRAREEEPITESMGVASDDDDQEDQFLTKRPRL